MYSEDFFIDLIFTEVTKKEEVKNGENKNEFWLSVGEITKKSSKNEIKKTEIEEEKKERKSEDDIRVYSKESEDVNILSESSKEENEEGRKRLNTEEDKIMKLINDDDDNEELDDYFSKLEGV